MSPESLNAIPAEHSWVGQLVGQRSQLIRAVQRIAGNRSEAEDVVQEAIVRAWRNPSLIADRRSVRGWVLGIARNVALDRMRTRRRRRETKELHSAIAAPSSMRWQPSARLQLQERKASLRGALDQVSPMSQQVVHLRHEQGLSFGEIGVQIGISEPTARKRYSRALSQLREALSA